MALVSNRSSSPPRLPTGGLSQRTRLAVAVGLAAALPIIVATVHGVVVGWVPHGDDGAIATRAYDVFTSNTPLVGVYSQVSGIAGRSVHSPGPMLYWLLALPAHSLPAISMTVVIGLVNVGAVIGAVALSGRRGGVPLMLGTAAAIALMLASLPAETLHDIWNPSAGLLPFTLLIFLSWSVACGDYRLLPLTVFVASFAIQSHLAFVLPSVALVVAGFGGLVASRRSPTEPPSERVDQQDSRPPGELRRSVILTVTVVVICWSFPVVDEIFHHPGNLTQIVSAALGNRGPTLGVAGGWHAVVRAIGIPPWWLRGPQSTFPRLADLLTTPGVLQIASSLLVLAGLIGVAILGWRRGRRDLAYGGVLALVLCAALFALMASAPSTGAGAFTNAYVSWWASPAGMWVWLVLGWSLINWLAPVVSGQQVRSVGIVPVLGVFVVLVIGTVVALGGDPDPNHQVYSAIRAISGRLDARLPRRGAVSVDACLTGAATLPTGEVLDGVIYNLRSRGVATGTTATAIAVQLGSEYAIGKRRYASVVDILSKQPHNNDGPVIARVAVALPGSTTKTRLYVTLAPALSGRPRLACAAST